MGIIRPKIGENVWTFIANGLGDNIFGQDSIGKVVLGVLFVLFVWFITVISGFSIYNQAIIAGMMTIALSTSQYMPEWVAVLWVILIAFTFGIMFSILFKD